jgi:hypothetical protein
MNKLLPLAAIAGAAVVGRQSTGRRIVDPVLELLYELNPDLRPAPLTPEEIAEQERQMALEEARYARKVERDLAFRRPYVSPLPRIPKLRIAKTAKALPAFSGFVADYCRGRRPDPRTAWVRTGNPNDFTEFTLRPNDPRGPAQMGPGRDSGTLTGQYSLGAWSDRERWNNYTKSKVKREGPAFFGLVPAPRNPFVVRGDPQDFNRAVRRILRVAAKSNDLAADLDPFDAAKVEGFRGLKATDYPLVLSSIRDWRRTQLVHPVNIILARRGYDGLTYEDAEEASSFGTGSVRFPPITRQGLIVGMRPVSGRVMRPTCNPLPYTPIPSEL